jgi:hypothetical protein
MTIQNKKTGTAGGLVPSGPNRVSAQTSPPGTATTSRTARFPLPDPKTEVVLTPQPLPIVTRQCLRR